MTPIAVALETGGKRLFAVAIDWPGWSRAGRSEEAALEALSDHAGRYASAVGEPSLAATGEFEVVERLPGGSGTDFGVPGAVPAADQRPLEGDELQRQVRLLRAAWEAFDAMAAGAAGRELRKGPRGGGRDLARMMGHVLDAEEAYLRQLGSRPPRRDTADDPGTAMVRVREAALETLAACAAGEEPPNANRVEKRWPPRYHVRRSAWHVLDHAWEIEDRLS